MGKKAAITSSRTRRRLSLALALAPALAPLLASCGTTLGEGEFGTPRVLGFVPGAPPLAMLAPASDRDGNIYVLAGARNSPDVSTFVLKAGGGVVAGCRLTKGDRIGPIGWVGFAQARQWYWSGTALVAMNGSGDCRRVLERDPVSGSELQFAAVFPWVSDRPSRTTIVALVQTPSDLAPSTVLVDLDNGVYTTARPFEPANATQVVVLGTGGSATRREGYGVMTYTDGGTKRTEARFYDDEGALTARIPVTGLDAVTAYGIPGFLQGSDAGLVAGIVDTKHVLLFDRSGARIVNVNGMEAVGVHVWNGSLFVVGKNGNTPAIAAVDDAGSLGGAVEWSSSAALVRKLAGSLTVADDRSPPRHDTVFDRPANALGPFPLVTEQTSARLAENETLLLVAGPTVGSGLAASTLVAVVPVGVSYP